MKKIDRIDGFLKSLEDRGIITAEMQSMVFSPEFGMLGGDNADVHDGCTNSSTACNGNNAMCTNWNVCDSTAKNGTCSNLNSNQLLCNPKPQNPDIHVCGTIVVVKNPYVKNCE